MQLHLLPKGGDVMSEWWHAGARRMGQVWPIRVPCNERRIEGVSWCSSRMLSEGGASFSEREEHEEVLLINQSGPHNGGLDMVDDV